MVAISTHGERHAVVLASWNHLPLRVRSAVALSDDELYAICQVNRDLRIERTGEGELIIMPPTGGETGRRNAVLAGRLQVWTEAEGTGVSFDSSTGFILPNGAERSPDAAWISRDRWQALDPDQREKFPPLCPDFVVELRSPSDDIDVLKAKMEEYARCGARLGWLIDPVARRVLVYRPDQPVEALEAPESVSGEDVLPGFDLDLGAIW
jgi:Uma2 family endonuclease